MTSKPKGQPATPAPVVREVPDRAIGTGSEPESATSSTRCDTAVPENCSGCGSGSASSSSGFESMISRAVRSGPFDLGLDPEPGIA